MRLAPRTLYLFPLVPVTLLACLCLTPAALGQGGAIKPGPGAKSVLDPHEKSEAEAEKEFLDALINQPLVVPLSLRANAAATKAALVSAGLVVLGRVSDAQAAALTSAVAADPQWKPKFEAGGLSHADAVTYLKGKLAQEGAGVARAGVIDNAYLDVYGSKAGPAQVSSWEPQLKTQKEWFATLVFKLNDELNRGKGPYDRRTVIRTVYYNAMGREPLDTDFSYWAPRQENYRQMLIAGRTWLYSDAGRGDLRDTIRRAFRHKLKKEPTEQEVSETAQRFAAKRLIYIEMVQ